MDPMRTDGSPAEVLRARLVAAVLACGGEASDVDALVLDGGEGECKALGLYLAGRAGFFTFDVDYGQSDAEYAERFRALVAAGNYAGFLNTDATPEHYPSNGLHGAHRRRVQLFRPDASPGQGYFTNRNVLDAITSKAAGKKQIKPYDLLTLAVKHERLGLDFPLVGSFDKSETWRDQGRIRRTLCVGGEGGQRILELGTLEGCWTVVCRFPVLCDVPGS